MVSQAELIPRVVTLWLLVLSQFFRDGMGPFNQNTSIEKSKQVFYENVCHIPGIFLPDFGAPVHFRGII